MDSRLNRELAAFVDTARSFAKKSIDAEKHDAPGAAFPSECFDAACELGFATAAIPSDIGGLGAGYLAAGLILEEVAASCAGVATAILANTAALLAITLAGGGKTKLPEPGKGKLSATIVGLPDVTIEEVSGKYLAGRATGIIGAGRSANYATIVKSSSGATLWLVPEGAGELKIEVPEIPLGLRASKPGKAIYNRVDTANATKVGDIDPDLLLALVAPLQACVAVGLARGAIDSAEKYARERYQGGDIIIRHDAVAHLILGNRASINAARSHARSVLAGFDAMVDPAGGRMSGSLDPVEPVLARTFATDMCLKAALDAMQCFGGYGYMKDYPVEKRLRDARSIGVVFGTAPELLSRIKGRIEEG